MLGKADVVVIGGGVIGCAVAYYLMKQGARVTIVERSAIGSGASSANSGAIAMATKSPGLSLDLAMASQALYPSLGRELGMDLEYAVQGDLIVAQTETETIYLENLAVKQQAAGVAAEIVSAARCSELNPLIDGGVLGGLYCATDAQVNPFKVTQGFAQAAQNSGAQVLADTSVNEIELANGRVSGVRTSRGTVNASWVVNAAGAYADDVGKMVGVEHQVIPRRGQIVVLEASPGMPAVRVAGAAQLLAKHSGPGSANAAGTNVAFSYTARPLSGTVLLGSTNEFVGFDTRTTREALREICTTATRLMPRLGDLNALRSWAGLRPYCAKGLTLGAGGGPEGYVTAIGHGGDGVALSPITGVYVAEVIAREGKGCELASFLEERKTTKPGSAA